MSYLVLFCSCVFGPFSVAVASLGKERAGLGTFHAFFDLRLFGFVCFLFLLGRAAVCDCGTPWTFLLPPFFFFFLYILHALSV